MIFYLVIKIYWFGLTFMNRFFYFNINLSYIIQILPEKNSKQNGYQPIIKVYYRLPMTRTALNMLIFRFYQQHSSALLN